MRPSFSEGFFKSRRVPASRPLERARQQFLAGEI